MYRCLSTLADSRGLSIPEWAERVGFWPTSCGYAYLRRLEGRGLAYRCTRCDIGGHTWTEYRITGKGFRKMLFLRYKLRIGTDLK